MPPAIPSLAAADAVVTNPDWRATNVAKRCSLTFKELMLAHCGEQREEPLVPHVLHVRQALLLSPAACPFRDCDAVAMDELRIDPGRILAIRDRPRHVELVTVAAAGSGRYVNAAGDPNGPCSRNPFCCGSSYCNLGMW